MSDDERPIPDDEWATIVERLPIVSVDLIVEHNDGIVLGRRQNEPAKGEWFVPGGTVVKNERLVTAVDRVANEELGVSVSIIERLGAYEHLYDAAEVAGVETKHYLANAFYVRPETETFELDDQHGELRVFEPPFDLTNHHPYVRQYLTEIRSKLVTE